MFRFRLKNSLTEAVITVILFCASASNAAAQLVGSQVYPDPALSTVNITIPHPLNPHAECRPGGSTFVLNKCVNRLIDLKIARQNLIITIAPGTYTLTDSILIFQRDNIYLRGGGTDPSQVVLQLPNPYRQSGESLTRYFTVMVFDSNRIEVANLTLDGGAVDGQRAIAVCPLHLSNLRDFSIRRVGGQNYVGIFSIFGNALSPDQLRTIAGETPKDGVLSGKSRLLAYLNSPIRRQAPSCNGSVSNIHFVENQLSLTSEGFYYVPFVADRRMIDSDAREVFDWYFLMNTFYASQHSVEIRRNTFRVAPNFVETVASNKAFHSFIKLHYLRDVLIDKNIFDAGPTTDTFAGGGMVNLAAGNRDVLIRGNRFTFSPTSNASASGITIESGILNHSTYGFGRDHLFPYSQNVTVFSNTYDRAGRGIRIHDCCAENETETCRSLDNEIATLGKASAKSDRLMIIDNVVPVRFSQSATGYYCRTNLDMQIRNFASQP